MSGVCRASSSRKQSCPYGASMTCSSTSLPCARSATASSSDPEGGYSQSELKAMSSVLARSGRTALARLPPPVLTRQVEIRQRPRHVEIRIRVEPLDERVGLVAQVALDLEFGIREHVTDVVGRLQAAVELRPQRGRREVGDVADHPRDAHARVRRAAGAVVVAAQPVGIGDDGVTRDRVPGDTLRLQRMRTRDRHDRLHFVRIGDGPLERLHATERAARDRRQLVDAELGEKCALGAHHVGDGDHREVGSVRPSRLRVVGRRAGRAAAAADEIRRDDEEAIGVEGLARPDHAVPPAETLAAAAVTLLGTEPVPRPFADGLCRHAGGVGVTAQGMTHENDVVARRRQLSIRFVGDAYGGQCPAGVECQGVRQIEELRIDRTHRTRGGSRGSHGHRRILSRRQCMMRSSLSREGHLLGVSGG